MATSSGSMEVPVHLMLDGYACMWLVDRSPKDRRDERGRTRPVDIEVTRKDSYYDGPDRRDPEHQHRRETDGEIRINTKKLTAAISLILGVITLLTVTAAFLGSRIATQRELDIVVDSLRSFRQETRDMHKHLDNENAVAQRERALIPKIVKAECLAMANRGQERDAVIVGLPCDSLLPGVFRQRVRER